LERLFSKLGVRTRTQAVVANDAVELRRLTEENSRLERALADLSLDNQKLRAVTR
jgi:hypothetical protein